MRVGRIATIAVCVFILVVLVRVWLLLEVWVNTAACAISPCHICPCPPFTFFGPLANPHCPEDPADIFPALTHEEVKTAGFLASSKLDFCTQNPFTGYLASPSAGKDLSPLYWDAEVKAEQFFRALFFSTSCLTRVAKKWDKFDLFNRTLDCPSLNASVLFLELFRLCMVHGAWCIVHFQVLHLWTRRYPKSNEDGMKYLCEVEQLKAPCVIYSLGSRNNYLFEDEMLKATPCEVIFSFPLCFFPLLGLLGDTSSFFRSTPSTAQWTHLKKRTHGFNSRRSALERGTR